MNEYRGDDQAAAQAWVFDRLDPPPHNSTTLFVDPGTPMGTNEISMTLDDPPQLTVNMRHGDTGDPLENVSVSTYVPSDSSITIDVVPQSGSEWLGRSTALDVGLPAEWPWLTWTGR